MEVEHIGDAAECGASATEPSQQKQQTTNDTENSGVKVCSSSVKTSSLVSEACSPKRKGRESNVWEYFTKNYKKDSNVVDGAQCKFCPHKYSYKSKNGTITLRSHVRVCPKIPQNMQEKIKKQKVLTSSQTKLGENSLGMWKFSQDFCRETLVKMVVMDELPFKFVERKGFHLFCAAIQPNWKPVSRMTVARDCLSLYGSEKRKLKQIFMKSNQRICLTTDTWTSVQNLSYMCLTAHWIDKDWKLHKRIINFCVISSHKGEALGKELEACLVDWGINKLCTLTVDNASANNVATGYLRRKFSKKSATFILGGECFHMRYCAHIINLIVKEGLTELKAHLARICAAMKYVRGSPQREQRFKKCVEMEGLACSKSMILDEPTQWNSTYLMLDIAMKYQKAFERLEEDDPLFVSEVADFGGPPTLKDWEEAHFLSQFFKRFYNATICLSGSLYVTAHLYFTEIYAIESFLYDMSLRLEDSLSNMAKKMMVKFEKYWGRIEKVNMMLVVAVVLDPRLKLDYVKFSYSEILTSDAAEELTKKVRNALYRLYGEYQKFESESFTSSLESFVVDVDGRSSNATTSTSVSATSHISKFQKYMKEAVSDEGRFEIDKYLEETVEKIDPNTSFDFLNWWKVNSLRYRVLSQVARDVLAIPVSTVASESAFSTGGRVLDQFRSSLTPKLVEALICIEDWLRDSAVSIDVEENIEEIKAIESEVVNQPIIHCEL
eukprot:TRINITY_DN4464_c0_g2_i4.p1 TRINITY_DN4464_c0_g2~~TRINITY_DN4464_c0_g2_i4.p1  ORF type:complete len:722 (-),score=131.76 TRINITY_DN4464_c0_g2_i4:535-2700(-)